MDCLTAEERLLWRKTLEMAQTKADLPQTLTPIINLLARLNECRKANIGCEHEQVPYSSPEIDEFKYYYPRLIRPWLVKKDFALDAVLFTPVDHPLFCDMH